MIVELAADLAQLAQTCCILPRSGSYAAVQVNFARLDHHPVLGSANRLADQGDFLDAWRSLLPLVDRSPAAALVGAAFALKAGDIEGSIGVLERLLMGLMGPALEIPPIDGAVVLAFSDEGMIKFDANALAGVALLILRMRAPDAARMP